MLLWPDTFTNFLQPEVAKAAVAVLEHAGYEVRLPDRVLCCGRPLYDFGMLTLAKSLISLREARSGLKMGLVAR